MIRIQEILNEASGAHLIGYLRERTPDLPDYQTRPAILVIPGGAYSFLSGREDEPIVTAFLQKGYHVFSLHYSVGEYARDAQPFIEAAHAMHLIREHATEWNIIPNKVAVIGFSAGGHLAGSLGILSGQPYFCERARLTCEQIRPNAQILVYPVVSSGEYAHRESFYNLTGSHVDNDETRRYSLERYITDQIPPTFVWHAVDDPLVPVENSMMLVTELQKHKVPYEAHFFHTGFHGASLATAEVNAENPHLAHWFTLACEWLEEMWSI